MMKIESLQKKIHTLLWNHTFWWYGFLLWIGMFVALFFVGYFFSPSLEDTEYKAYIASLPPIETKESTEEKELFLLDTTSETSPLEEVQITPEDIANTQKLYEDMMEDMRKKMLQEQEKESKKDQVIWSYFPPILEKYMRSNSGVLAIQDILVSDLLTQLKPDFFLSLYKKKDQIRGRFVDNTIELYGVGMSTPEELVGVFVHELGHYIDIEYFDKKVFYDISEDFYKISWDGLRVLKPGSIGKDFVSGYAMTNKYEDFAESFIYYVLYNEDFVIKALDNKVLAQKYLFFSTNLFSHREFQNTNFRIEWERKSYYWDITKIWFSLQNFLQYLKKWI